MHELTGKVVGVRSVLGDNGSAGEIQHLVTIKLDRLPEPESCLWLGQEFMFAQMPVQEATDAPGTGPAATEEEPTGEPEPSSVTPEPPTEEAATNPQSELPPRGATVCGECGVPLPKERGSHLRRYCRECGARIKREKKRASAKRKTERKKSAKKSAAVLQPPEPESPEQPVVSASQPVAAEPSAVADIIEFATKMVDHPGTENMFMLLEQVQRECTITPTQMGMVREERGDDWLLQQCRSEDGLKELTDVAAGMQPKRSSGSIEIDFQAEGIGASRAFQDGPGVNSGASIEEAAGLETIVLRSVKPQP